MERQERLAERPPFVDLRVMIIVLVRNVWWWPAKAGYVKISVLLYDERHMILQQEVFFYETIERVLLR